MSFKKKRGKKVYSFTINNETQMAVYTFWLAMQGYFLFFLLHSIGFFPHWILILEKYSPLFKNKSTGKKTNEQCSRIKNTLGTFFIGFAFLSKCLNRGCEIVFPVVITNNISLCSFPRCLLFPMVKVKGNYTFHQDISFSLAVEILF